MSDSGGASSGNGSSRGGDGQAGVPSQGEVLEQLDGLIGHQSLGASQNALVNLRAALITEGASPWAQVDLGLIFSDDAVSDPKAAELSAQIVRWESARNIAVLIPLLITWIGIALATRAYGELLAQDPAAAQAPFVQLWQEGFNGAASWPTPSFSLIGGLDALAILVVLIMSVVLAKLRSGYDVEVPKSEIAVANSLREAVANSAVLLAQKAQDSPLYFEASLGRVADRLDATALHLNGLITSATTIIDTSNETVGTLSETADRIAGAASAVSTGLDGARSALDETKLKLGEVVESETNLTTEVKDAIGVLAAAEDTLGGAVDKLDTTADKVGRDFATGTKSAADVLTAADKTTELLVEARTQLDGLVALVPELQENTRAISEAIRGMNEAAAEAKHAAKTVDEKIGDHAETLPGRLAEIVDELDRIINTQHANSMASDVEAHSRMTAALERVERTFSAEMGAKLGEAAATAFQQVIDAKAAEEQARRRGVRGWLDRRRNRA